MNLNVLVTGGAGFIGSNLVERLVNEGYNVTVVDNFSYCRTGQLEKVKNKISILNFDVQDGDKVVAATEGKDYIVHLAAQKSVDKSIQFPVDSGKQNILSLINLLEGARKNKVKRVIFVSSAAVYGYNDNFPLKESETVDPRSPYALEKVVGEQYLKLYYKLYNLDSISLRLFNVYGPSQYSSGTHCGGVTIVMNELMKTKIGNILGNGLQTRDMIYVGDVVSAIHCSIKAETQLGGDIVNICTGIRTSIRDMIQIIANNMNIKEYSLNELEFTKGNVVHSEGSTVKAKEIINFEAQINIKEGINLTWEWFNKNRDFYDSK